MPQKNTFENIYIMHTKVKELVDVHYQRYVEVKVGINQKVLSNSSDFASVREEFIRMYGEVENIQMFLRDSFDENLQTHKLLYSIFADAITNFLLLLEIEIAMFAKLIVKATATGRYGFFEFRRDTKIRNAQSDLTLLRIQALIKENTKTVHIDSIREDVLILVDYALHLTVNIKGKYYHTPVKDVNCKAIREELLALYEEVAQFQCHPNSINIKEDILVITKQFGLLVRDRICGVEITRERQTEVMDSLDVLKEKAYSVLCFQPEETI